MSTLHEVSIPEHGILERWRRERHPVRLTVVVHSGEDEVPQHSGKGTRLELSDPAQEIELVLIDSGMTLDAFISQFRLFSLLLYKIRGVQRCGCKLLKTNRVDML